MSVIVNGPTGAGGVSDVDDLTTTTGTATYIPRVAAAGGLEYRTPAQVRSDIGAEASGAAATKLPLDGSSPMTGGIAYAGNSPLLNFTPSADLDHTFMEYAPQVTPTLKWKWNMSAGISFPGDLVRPDVTFNWGYNQGVQGGRSNTADAAWFLQLENHYFPAGNGVAQFEYHLNIVDTAGVGIRPFQINAKKDGSLISHSYLGDTFLWTNRAGSNLFGFSTGDKIVSYMPLDVKGTITATTQILLQAAGNTTPILSIAPGTAVIDFTGNPTTTDLRFYNFRKFLLTGFTEFSVTATNNYFYGDVYAIRSAAGTNTPARVFTAWRTLSSGTAADGIGANFDFIIQTATGGNGTAARVRSSWATAATDTRVGEIALEAFDYNSTSVARTGVVVRASAAGEPLLAFYQGVTPIARQVLATGTGVTTDQLLAGLQALGLFKQA